MDGQRERTCRIPREFALKWPQLDAVTFQVEYRPTIMREDIIIPFHNHYSFTKIESQNHLGRSVAML